MILFFVFLPDLLLNLWEKKETWFLRSSSPVTPADVFADRIRSRAIVPRPFTLTYIINPGAEKAAQSRNSSEVEINQSINRWPARCCWLALLTPSKQGDTDTKAQVPNVLPHTRSLRSKSDNSVTPIDSQSEPPTFDLGPLESITSQ